MDVTLTWVLGMKLASPARPEYVLNNETISSSEIVLIFIIFLLLASEGTLTYVSTPISTSSKNKSDLN